MGTTMKRAALLASLLIPAFLAPAQEITVGVFIHPPHVYLDADSKKPYGPAIDYISNVIADMGYSPTIVLLPLTRILIALRTGEVDVSLELLKSSDREEYLYYPEQPSYTMVPSLTVLATNPLTEIRSIDDVRGMKIGYLSGAITTSFFANATGIRFESVSGDTWIQQNLAKLLTRRIDAALDNNAYSYLEEARKTGVTDKIRTLSLPEKGTNYYVVFSKTSKRGADLLEKYNSLIASGRYDEQRLIEEFVSEYYR